MIKIFFKKLQFCVNKYFAANFQGGYNFLKSFTKTF